MIAGIIILLLFIIMCWLIRPNRKRFQSFPSPLFAHRGLHNGTVPENSLAAFIRARQGNYGVELDVRLTADKKPVVFHDDDLKRLCGEEHPVCSLSYEELSRYRLLGTDQKVPLFEEVLRELQGVPVICEIKSLPGEPVEEICEAVCREVQDYPGFLCFESFNPFVLQWFRKNRPEFIRGQLSMNFMKMRDKLSFINAFAMTHLLVNAIGRPDFIAYRHTDDAAGFFLCRKIFRPVCAAWTVRGEAEQKQAGLKYQAIIFEEI